MKKLFMIGMSIVLCLVLMATPVSANTVGTAEISSATGDRGQIVYLTVSIADFSSASSIGITWDGLSPVMEESKWLLEEGTLEYIKEDGAMWAVDGLTDLSGDVLLLAFMVPAEDDGMTAYPVTVTVTLYTANAEFDPVTATGYVRVTCAHENTTEFSANPSTCTEAGNNLYFYCNDCQLYLKADKATPTVPENEVLPLAEHDFHWVIEKEATENEPGWKHEECENCDARRSENTPIAILQHKHKPTKVSGTPATCTKEGTLEHWICETEKCAGKLYTDETCTKQLTSLTIPATGHTEVVDKAVAATCTTPGKTEGSHCSVCSTVIKAQTTVKATGHTEVVDKAVAATCTTPGKTEGSHCSVCSTVIKAQTTVNATGHTEVVDKAVAATCTTPGKTEGSHCSVCNTVIKAQTTVNAKGHTEVVDKAVAATCTTPGKTEGSHCSVCNTVIKAQTTVNALEHAYSAWQYNAADKTHTKTCQHDATHTETENCSFDGGVVVTEPAVGKDGEKKFTCTVCGGSYTEAIPALEDEGIQRVFGATRYDTAIAIAEQLKKNLGVSKFNAIVVASGTDFADALPGAYLANQKGAPVLLVRNRNQELNLVKDYIKANLAPGGTVYILGGEKAVPKAMETGLDGFTVKRLGGATRYETNLLILKEGGVKVGDDILVCTGKDFPDSLAASAVNKPILLVKDSLNASQKTFLDSVKGGKLYIIGGTAAVNARIETALKGYGETQRLSGATRYYTSVEIAKAFFPNTTKAVLAYGENFPDGMCGGTLAYSMGAPVLLTTNSKSAASVSFTTANGIHNGAVLGGTALISDKIVEKTFG